MGPPKDRGIPLPVDRIPWSFYVRAWGDTWKEQLEERAGILEFAGVSHLEAESAAVCMVL